MGSGFGMGGGMWILWIALIGLVVWALYAVTGRMRPPPDNRRETPLDVVKKRLARGEIDAEEYRRLRDELEK
jgi:putative membrane protein